MALARRSISHLTLQTIIEALKYACTGSFPPNIGKGHAFVHDTKVAGEKEIKAQISLRFRGPTGRPIVVKRSLSLKQIASKQEIKTLDSNLITFNDKDPPEVVTL